MTDIKKFLFDLNDFDEEAIAKELEEQEPELPSFSEEELEAAKAESYQKGRLAGIDEERQSILQKTHDLLTTLPAAFNDILSREQTRTEQFTDDAIAMTLDALEKSFPSIYDATHLTELKNALKEHITQNLRHGKLVIFVENEIAEDIEQHISSLQLEKAEHQIQVRPSSDLPKGHAKIEWEHGGALWSPLEIQEIILQTFTEHLPDHYKSSIITEDENQATEKTTELEKTENETSLDETSKKQHNEDVSLIENEDVSDEAQTTDHTSDNTKKDQEHE